MRLNLYVFAQYILLLFFVSCTVQNQSLLLTDQTPCTATTCPQAQTSITGNLGIFPSQTSMYVNVDQSDLAEISGTCTDLGVRQNKIIVEAYEGEDTSVGPYMSNAATYKCTGSTTVNPPPPAMPIWSLNGKRCLFLPEGKGIIDGEAEYPQCFNGRFSFSVRLGKILRTDPYGGDNLSSNPLKNYLVRMKIVRGDGGNPIESGWNQVVISRSISKPSFSTSTDGNTGICSIKTNAARNVGLTDVSYKGIMSGIQYVSGSYSASPLMGTQSVYPLTPDRAPAAPGIQYDDKNITYPHDSSSGISVNLYKLNNLVPGLKYEIKIIAEDRNPNYVYSLNPLQTITGRGNENSGYSAAGICYSPPVTQFVAGYVTGGGAFCHVKVKNDITLLYTNEVDYIDWVFIKNGPQSLSSSFDINSITTTCTWGASVPSSCKITNTAVNGSFDWGYNDPLGNDVKGNASDFRPSSGSRVGTYQAYYRFRKAGSPDKYGDWSSPAACTFQ